MSCLGLCKKGKLKSWLCSDILAPMIKLPKRKIFFALLLLLLSPHMGWCEQGAPFERQPWSYRLGEGLRLGESPFYLGGYINAQYIDAEEKRETLSLENLSLFVFGDLGERSRFFAELEDEEIFEVDSHGVTETENEIRIERIYADYLHSDHLTLRAGKFFTPIGTWNEKHAPPLTWTVSRPIVTFATFPEDMTGIQLVGNFSLAEEDLDYSFFAQKNESINEKTGFRRTHEAIGGRICWLGSPGLEIGVPLLYYEEYEIKDKIYLTGIDFSYKQSPFELRGEATYSDVNIKSGGRAKEYGYYLQGVSGITERLSLVLRYDFFQAREGEKRHKALTTGLVYKPEPPLVFKIEYQTRSGSLVYTGEESIDDSERLLASFSVLL